MLLVLFVNLKDKAGDIPYFCYCQQMACKDWNHLLKLSDFPQPVSGSQAPGPVLPTVDINL